MKVPYRLLGLLAVGALGVGIYEAGFDEIKAPAQSTDVIIHGGSVHGERMNSHSWQASYDNLKANADQSVVDMTGVHNGLIFRHGQPYLTFRASEMTVNTITHDFTARGAIHVETIDKQNFRSFDTTQAAWSEAGQRLLMNDHVTLRTGMPSPLNIEGLSVDVHSGVISMGRTEGALRL